MTAGPSVHLDRFSNNMVIMVTVLVEHQDKDGKKEGLLQDRLLVLILLQKKVMRMRKLREEHLKKLPIRYHLKKVK